MAYEMSIDTHLHMPSLFLRTFTKYSDEGLHINCEQAGYCNQKCEKTWINSLLF